MLKQIFSDTRKKDYSPLELLKIKKICFALIKNKRKHKEIRKVPKFMKNEDLEELIYKTEEVKF